MIVVPIYFYDEARGAAEEVHDVIADDLLAPKLDPQPLAANGGPEKLLRVGGMVAHEASAALEELLAF